MQLCDTALAAGGLPVLRTVKPHVAVVIDLEDLADPATGPATATMGFGAVISAARARWIACDSTVSRVVFGPDGAPIDLGREQRLADRYLRRAVELRDGGCVFTGCGAPTWWAEVHHLIHWLDGGETNLNNSALLCERHHTQVHHGFRVERQPDGTWRTWRPDGTEIRTGPPLVRPAA
ncbi:HNH endonuclease signature motif containing protein [Geodermatophilus tzadiensis]|uniref:HNH endonuclease signature motif containing protein n=1 Tax=Geodermatophilus tzadiensis TaxID=1137988 RepID=UPI003183B73E